MTAQDSNVAWPRPYRHSGHLNVVDEAHELVQQADWEVRILQAVHGQAPPRLNTKALPWFQFVVMA